MRRHPNIYSQWGARLGPQANGALSQKFRAPQLRPPAVREGSPCKLLTFFRSPDQVEYPASMNADACRGFSVTGYQAWEIAYRPCEARFSSLLRLSGPVSKGHDFPKHTAS